MARYRNTGAPFVASDGTEVGTGEEAELPDRDYEMRRYKLVPLKDETWTLSTSPEEYLVRWPEGPKADLARRLVD